MSPKSFTYKVICSVFIIAIVQLLDMSITPAPSYTFLLSILGGIIFLGFVSSLKEDVPIKKKPSPPLRELKSVFMPSYPKLAFWYGDQQMFETYFHDKAQTGDAIIGVALRDWDGKIYFAQSPGRNRHLYALMDLVSDTKERHDNKEHGFLTSAGKFVNPKIALVMARRTGQIHNTENISTLQSEHLW